MVACPPSVALVRVALSAPDLLTASLDDSQSPLLAHWTDGATCQGQTMALCEGVAQVLLPAAPGLLYMQRVDANNTPLAAAHYRFDQIAILLLWWWCVHHTTQSGCMMANEFP